MHAHQYLSEGPAAVSPTIVLPEKVPALMEISAVSPMPLRSRLLPTILNLPLLRFTITERSGESGPPPYLYSVPTWFPQKDPGGSCQTCSPTRISTVSLTRSRFAAEKSHTRRANNRIGVISRNRTRRLKADSIASQHYLHRSPLVKSFEITCAPSVLIAAGSIDGNPVNQPVQATPLRG